MKLLSHHISIQSIIKRRLHLQYYPIIKTCYMSKTERLGYNRKLKCLDNDALTQMIHARNRAPVACKVRWCVDFVLWVQSPVQMTYAMVWVPHPSLPCVVVLLLSSHRPSLVGLSTRNQLENISKYNCNCFFFFLNIFINTIYLSKFAVQIWIK